MLGQEIKKKVTIFFKSYYFSHLCWHSSSQRQIHIGDAADLIYQWLSILKRKKPNHPDTKTQRFLEGMGKKEVLHTESYRPTSLTSWSVDLVLHFQAVTNFPPQILPIFTECCFLKR